MDYNKQQSDLFIELMRLAPFVDIRKNTNPHNEKMLELSKRFRDSRPPQELLDVYIGICELIVRANSES